MPIPMPHSITFTTDFPGGNALIERQDGDTVWLRQDLRDTAGDWFYWAFRVQHAQGRRLTFHFTGSEVLTARGPAFSRDAGATWQWLGTTALAGNGFTFDFGPDDCDIRFALAPAYGLAHWQAKSGALA